MHARIGKTASVLVNPDPLERERIFQTCCPRRRVGTVQRLTYLSCRQARSVSRAKSAGICKRHFGSKLCAYRERLYIFSKSDFREEHFLDGWGAAGGFRKVPDITGTEVRVPLNRRAGDVSVCVCAYVAAPVF